MVEGVMVLAARSASRMQPPVSLMPYVLVLDSCTVGGARQGSGIWLGSIFPEAWRTSPRLHKVR